MRLRTNTLILTLGLASVVGCKNPADEAPKAQVAEATRPAAEAAPAAHEALAISPAASQIRFIGSKVTGQHEGGFKDFSGTIHLDPKAPEASRIEVNIDMNSVWTDTERLTSHLKSGDFFLVQEHPTARFVTTQVAKGGQGDASHTITGNLTLRGVTKTVTFPATVNVGPDAVRAKAEFALPRKQFGIAFEGAPDNLVRDEVKVMLDVVAPRNGQAAAGAQPGSGQGAGAAQPAGGAQ
jgi:polyisoprenoid-binding protein YceI